MKSWVYVKFALCSLIGCLMATVAQAQARSEKESKPWRASAALNTPDWLDFGLEHRSRFEHLINDFRAGADRDVTALSMRTLLNTEFHFNPVFVGLELLDSRAYASSDAPLNTTHANPLELLQAYVGLRLRDLYETGDRLELRVGRLTMNVGSRRLVSRNRFRNTINAFTGIDAFWVDRKKSGGGDGHTARLFAVMPVTRLPNDPSSLQDNEIHFDEEDTGTIFTGMFYGSPKIGFGTELEAYVLGIYESDRSNETTNRRLLTPGLRWIRSKAKKEFDFGVEAAFQLGLSRASRASTDIEDLSHRAFFTHLHAGYTLGVPWRPRLLLQYEFASGDLDPEDNIQGRFDTLFGSRRFEYGPTGFHGAFARSNISTPGLRVEVTPSESLSAFIGYRLYWLASKLDAWTTAGLQDPLGNSGLFIGHQVETSVRWHILPGNLSLEMGAAHLIRGEFAVNAPNGSNDPATYFYTQMTGTI